MSNQITVVGNLSADPEMRFTPAGMAVCSLRLADNHGKKKDDGTWEDGIPTWWRVTVFKKAAEVAAEWVKGDKIIVWGRVETEEWEDKTTKEKRSEKRIIANEVGLVSRPAGRQQPQSVSDDQFATAPF
jgi:single-strand DNA-binding protein